MLGLFERKTVDPLEAAARAPFVDDEAQIRESLAFKNGIIAFDIVFDKHGTPYVLEIQSTDAGAKGISEGLATDPRVPTEIKELARRVNVRKSGYKNPTWFNAVSDNKDEQLAFIPLANRPRSVVSGNFDSLFSYGKVILKPLTLSQGNGIRIFDCAHKAEAVVYATALENRYGGFVAQSFIESSGAEEAPEHLRKHAASLRLFIPFDVVNGKIVVAINNFGYQRVAPQEMPQNPANTEEYDTAGVVNLSRKAHPVPMSSSEYKRALPVALTVIKNLMTNGESSSRYRQEFESKLQQVVSDVYFKFDKTFPAFHLYMSSWYSTTKLRDMRSAVRFIRFVERALSLMQPDTVEKLKKKSAHISFTYGTNGDGTIRVYIPGTFKGADKKFAFSTNESPLVITRLVDDVANGKKLKK